MRNVASPRLSVVSPIGLMFLAACFVVATPARLCAQTYSVLYSFTGGADGANPQGGVILDTAGNLYGTTGLGGNTGCYITCGVVYKLDPTTGNETVLYSFTGKATGGFPRGGLTLNRNYLYGTTYEGGFRDLGSIFRVNLASGETSAVYSFGSKNKLDGAFPYASPIAGGEGNGYGTTPGGGPGQKGTVYEINSTGESIFYSFEGRSDGAEPYAGLIRDAAGNLYGTAALGGDTKCAINPPLGCGTVFKVDKFGH